MATTGIVGLERAWRRFMLALGKTHPNAVNRNRILVRVLDAEMRRRAR